MIKGWDGGELPPTHHRRSQLCNGIQQKTHSFVAFVIFLVLFRNTVAGLVVLLDISAIVESNRPTKFLANATVATKFIRSAKNTSSLCVIFTSRHRLSD